MEGKLFGNVHECIQFLECGRTNASSLSKSHGQVVNTLALVSLMRKIVLPAIQGLLSQHRQIFKMFSGKFSKHTQLGYKYATSYMNTWRKKE